MRWDIVFKGLAPAPAPALALVLALTAATLAGCQQEKAPDGPNVAAPAAGETAAMPRPMPGRYRSSAELVSLEAPGLPAGAAAGMKQLMASKVTPQEFCLKPDEAARGYEERVKKLSGRPDCHFDHYSATGGKLDARLTCTGGEGEGALRSVLAMQGTMAPDGSDITIGMDQSGAGLPGGGLKLVMRVRSARVGDCPAG